MTSTHLEFPFVGPRLQKSSVPASGCPPAADSPAE